MADYSYIKTLRDAKNEEEVTQELLWHVWNTFPHTAEVAQWVCWRAEDNSELQDLALEVITEAMIDSFE